MRVSGGFDGRHRACLTGRMLGWNITDSDSTAVADTACQHAWLIGRYIFRCGQTGRSGWWLQQWTVLAPASQSHVRGTCRVTMAAVDGQTSDSRASALRSRCCSSSLIHPHATWPLPSPPHTCFRNHTLDSETRSNQKVYWHTWISPCRWRFDCFGLSYIPAWSLRSETNRRRRLLCRPFAVLIKYIDTLIDISAEIVGKSQACRFYV